MTCVNLLLIQSLNPKGSILRTDIISAEPSTAFSDRVYVFTITSNDKWHVSAADEVRVFCELGKVFPVESSLIRRYMYMLVHKGFMVC